MSDINDSLPTMNREQNLIILTLYKASVSLCSRAGMVWKTGHIASHRTESARYSISARYQGFD